MFEFLSLSEKVKKIFTPLLMVMISLDVTSLSALPSSSSSSSSARHHSQTIVDVCGERHITLDYNHPHYVIKFPAPTSSAKRTAGIQKHTHSKNIVRLDHNEEEQELAQQDYFYLSNDDFIYQCEWVVATDSYHKIGAKVKINNESDYFMSIVNENGLITNCTSKSFTFESETPAVQLRFRTRQINSQPATRFSAKFFTSPLNSDRGGAAILALWILLIALTAVLIVFASIIYLLCMKRKLIFSRILTILRLKNSKGRTEPKKKKITLPNGTKVTIANVPRQQRCSVSSVQFNSFERMPTILEETENDTESRASSRKLSEALRKVSSNRDCHIAEKSVSLPPPPPAPAPTATTTATGGATTSSKS